ncbi:MAG: DUF2752 domain-containing protein [Clostridia bacterium]|nr:DUF2752 domain-containing protein [Clostridia bacterium]MBN2884040.1 DUF2752 domain-containing protein [Clostridia bacterium]
MDIRKIKKHIPFFLAILVIVLFLLLASVDLCLFRRLTGLPCPSCGMTRAYISLFKGNIANAFFMHPLFPLVPVIMILLIVSRYRKKHFTKTYIALGFIFLITYIIRMIFLFPHTPPFDYEFGSLLGRILFP